VALLYEQRYVQTMIDASAYQLIIAADLKPGELNKVHRNRAIKPRRTQNDDTLTESLSK